MTTAPESCEIRPAAGPGTGAVPLTDLLGSLLQPAVIVARSGALAWANPPFHDLFASGAVPATVAEWESRSPRGTGSLWTDLQQQRRLQRRLACDHGLVDFRLSLVGRPGAEDFVLLCGTDSGPRGLEELRERTSILETIFHSLNEGVLAIDAREHIIAMSRSAERITGFAETEVLGRPCHEVFQPPPGVECPFQSMLRKGEGFYQKDMTIRGKGGRPIHIAANATLLKAPGGTIDGAVVVLRDLSEIDRLRQGISGGAGFHGIVGSHPSIRRVTDKIETVAPSEASILIQGESGTGKELVARAIHNLSGRKNGPFIKVNCAALADTLLESELFGHIRGAFTGAVKDRPGRFEAADGGTLFLDEIGETTPALQVKLLRVLQEGEYERVGESRSRRADVRIVAATNKDLRREAAAGRFRDDLFFRLCVVPVDIPPLRDRMEDVPLLADHFLKRLAIREGRRKVLTTSAYPLLQRYEWPGNVRELENALAHAYVCTAGDVIAPDALPEHVLRGDTLFSGDGVLAEERKTIQEALEECGWNKGEAAVRLGVSRTTLWRRMRDLGIRDPRRHARS